MIKIYRILKNIVFSCVFFLLMIYLLAFYAPLYRFEESYLSTGVIDSFYFEDEGDIDVVFIGSSAVYRFIAPTVMYKEHGITSMNFATAGMPVECFSGALDEVIEKQHPKVVMLELRDFIKYSSKIDQGIDFFEEKYVSARESLISRLVNNMPVSLNRSKIIHDSVPATLKQDELDWHLEYLRTHNNWKNISIYDFKDYTLSKLKNEKIIRNIDGKYYGEEYKGTILCGRVHYNNAVDYSDYDTVKAVPKERMKIIDTLINQSKQIEQKYGTKVIFLSTPYPENELRASYENYLADYFKSKKVDYLNCNKYYKEIGIDFTTDYYDNKHCNYIGGAKVTKFIGKFLAENYNLKATDLSDEKAKEWKNASEKWYKDVYEPGSTKILNKVYKCKANGNTNY